MNRWLGIVFVALAAIFAAACSKPQPPQIVPKAARVSAISPQGVDLVITVEATNPNAVTLSAQSFTGKAKLDNQYELGTVTVNKPVSLPPHQPTTIDVPMTLPWTNLGALAALSQTQKPVPYTIDGSVTVGGESLNVSLPFTINGTITKEQLQAAAMRSIPNIPGLTIPQKL